MKRWCLLLFVLVVFIFGCATEKYKLSDLQVVACDSAAANNNCVRLSDLGIVTSSQCCSSLGKCCGDVTGKFVAWAGMTTHDGLSGLSDFQVVACKSAAANNNCVRLSDLGLVAEADCCSNLGLCCSRVPIADFKSVLLNAITSYFSATPTLTADELKDLINAYFASKDFVDLSVVGSFSDEKLTGIYGKAKASGCVPKTVADCSAEGWVCGSMPDGCGDYVDCGNCTQTCGYIPAESIPSFARLKSISLSAGEERVYVTKIDSNTMTYLKVKILGLTQWTDATVSLELPDGRVFPTTLNTGQNRVLGDNVAAQIILYSQKESTPNIPDEYLPSGYYVLRINAQGVSSIMNSVQSTLDFYLAKESGGQCSNSVLTCAQKGGSCKENKCDTYTECSDLPSGICTSGYCCLGSCTAATASVTVPPGTPNIDNVTPPYTSGFPATIQNQYNTWSCSQRTKYFLVGYPDSPVGYIRKIRIAGWYTLNTGTLIEPRLINTTLTSLNTGETWYGSHNIYLPANSPSGQYLLSVSMNAAESICGEPNEMFPNPTEWITGGWFGLTLVHS